MNEAERRALAELLLLGDHQAYIARLRVLVEKLKNQLKVDLSDLLNPPAPPPDPRSDRVLTARLIRSYLRSGDGDADPVRPVVYEMLDGLRDVYQDRLADVENQITQLK